MDQKQFERKLGDAEIRLKRLRSLYEQWFHGLERLEPAQPRRELDALITELRRSMPRNTALRFRFNQVVQRYTTYNTYWRRIGRQIEEGTYKRDVLRARRIAVKAEEKRRDDVERPGAYEIDPDADADVDAALAAAMRSDPPADAAGAGDADGAGNGAGKISRLAQPSDKPSAGATGGRRSFPAPPGPRPPGAAAAVRGAAPKGPPPLPPGAAGRRPIPPPPPPTRKAAGPSEAELQQLYQRYVAARAKNSERTDNVKMEAVARSVRKMLPQLEKKHAGKKIDFDVVVRNGKVALKPVAK